jgi:hypothetical protein
MSVTRHEDQGESTLTVGNDPHVRDKEDVPHEGALPDLYALGAADQAARERAHERLRSARVVARTDIYRSESLIITRCETAYAEAYYIVVESDCVFPEDVDALETLGVEVGEPWRTRILETDIYGSPHPELPMSSTFQVHVVHPSVPEGTAKRRIALAG